MSDEALLAEQCAYYRARAAEYDQWFRRQGRYDHGPAENDAWHAEVGVVRARLDAFEPRGDVLELACGTGLWSERLLPHAHRLTLIDAAPEALALCRARLSGAGRGAQTEYLLADLFSWRPSRRYDVVVFAFWLSLVPAARFDAFWRLVSECLAPGGRVFLVDSLLASGSGARDHVAPADGISPRRLDDGREFRVVKVFHQPAELGRRLRARGFRTRFARSGRFFLYGEARLR